ASPRGPRPAFSRAPRLDELAVAPFAPVSSRSTSGPLSSRSAVRGRFTCTRQVADLARLQVRFGPGERSLGVGTTELVRREPTLSSPFVRDVPVEELSRVRHRLRRALR